MKSRFALIMGIIVSVGVLNQTASAESVCNTLEECRALQTKVDTRIKELLMDVTPNLTDIAKNPDGSVDTMNHKEAEEYCAKQDLRLPTARELALYSQSLGAKGVSDTGQDGYYPIYTKNEAGQKVVDFYFNYKGYKRPTGDLGKYWFWSSSVYPGYSSYAYGLGGDDGDVDDYDRSDDYNSAVRCVRSR